MVVNSALTTTNAGIVIADSGNAFTSIDINHALTGATNLDLHATTINVAGGFVQHAQSGDLILNGAITLDGVGDVTLNQDGDSSNLTLGTITANNDGSTNNLNIRTQDAAVTLSTIALADSAGDGVLDIDLDGIGTQSLTLSGAVTQVSGVDIAGTGTNDTVLISAGVTTTDASDDVTLSVLSGVDLDSALTSAGGIDVTATTITLSGNVTHHAQSGNLNLTGSVVLDGTGTVTLHQDGAANFSLGSVTSVTDASQNHLTIQTDDASLSLPSIDLDETGVDGTLTVQLTGNTTAQSLTLGGTVSNVGDIAISGVSGNDSIVVNSALTTTNAGIVIADSGNTVSSIDINNAMTAATGLDLHAGAITLAGGFTQRASNGDLTLNGTVTLDGSGTVTLDQDGSGSNFSVGNVTSVTDGSQNHLTVQTDDTALSLGTVDLQETGVDGTLTVQLTASGNTAQTLTLGGAVSNVRHGHWWYG